MAGMSYKQHRFPPDVIRQAVWLYFRFTLSLREVEEMLDNHRAENSHLLIRRRERQQQKFKTQGSAQRFLATHAAVYNTFNVQRHLISRSTLRLFRAEAHAAWATATASA